jgi:cytochrome c oxidase cbb3-type subunit 4
MSPTSLSYETVARFAQQGGAIYFAAMFVAVLIYALWPRNRDAFRRAAQLPLDEEN